MKRFVEVDFPGVTARKCFMIKRHRQLLAAVASGEEEEVRLNRTDLHSPRYRVVYVALKVTVPVEFTVTSAVIVTQTVTAHC